MPARCDDRSPPWPRPGRTARTGPSNEPLALERATALGSTAQWQAAGAGAQTQCAYRNREGRPCYNKIPPADLLPQPIYCHSHTCQTPHCTASKSSKETHCQEHVFEIVPGTSTNHEAKPAKRSKRQQRHQISLKEKHTGGMISNPLRAATLPNSGQKAGKISRNGKNRKPSVYLGFDAQAVAEC